MLPHFEAFREEDPLPERVLNQILVGQPTTIINDEGHATDPPMGASAVKCWRPSQNLHSAINTFRLSTRMKNVGLARRIECFSRGGTLVMPVKLYQEVRPNGLFVE